ncbi:unnamed protein product [Choristocarpus tenellus]
MRLRSTPRAEQGEPQEGSEAQGVGVEEISVGEEGEHPRNIRLHSGHPEAMSPLRCKVDNRGVGQWGEGGGHREWKTQPPCPHAQDLAWFLLTSACLSKGAQGEVIHDPCSGQPRFLACKNVELGVLFHSSPTCALYAEPSCRCNSPPLHLSQVNTTTTAEGVNAIAESSKENRDGVVTVQCISREHKDNRGNNLKNRPQVTGAPNRQWVSGVSSGVGTPHLVYTSLPVPFCITSEGYAGRNSVESPHVRFLPFMHDLEPEGARSAEIMQLLTSEEVEAQFTPTRVVQRSCSEGPTRQRSPVERTASCP